MIVVVAALKGGVGKTTTSVYLAAVASTGRRDVTLIDADAQASAAEWLERDEDDQLAAVSLVEAPTGRLLSRALGRIDPDDVGIVDSPPGNERMLEKVPAMVDTGVHVITPDNVKTPEMAALLDPPVGKYLN